jgi:hypothetical protein
MNLQPRTWNIGTRSVVFGAHCLPLHWLFVARGWISLYGFPIDPRIWCAFVLHDVGYIGMPNMDGDEGELHPMGGAKIMRWLFDCGEWDSSWFANSVGRLIAIVFGRHAPRSITPNVFGNLVADRSWSWYCFAFYHSRFMAKRYGIAPSPLCFADKLVPTYEPAWLYLPRVRFTGELREYMDTGGTPRPSKGWTTRPYSDDRRAQAEWYKAVGDYMLTWVLHHRYGADDTWTQRA